MNNSFRLYLEEASNRGFIGENEVQTSIELSQAFLEILPKNKKYKVLDLACGIGIPGLLLALDSNFKVDFLDSNQRRVSYLKNFLLLNEVESEVFSKRYNNAHDLVGYDIVVSRGFLEHEKLVKDCIKKNLDILIVSTTKKFIPTRKNQKIFRRQIKGKVFYIGYTNVSRET